MLFLYKFSVILMFLSLFLVFANVCNGTLDNDEGQNGSQKYRVDGTVSVPFTVDQSWTANTRVIVDGGQRVAFLRFALIYLHYSSELRPVTAPHAVFRSFTLNLGKVLITCHREDGCRSIGLCIRWINNCIIAIIVRYLKLQYFGIIVILLFYRHCWQLEVSDGYNVDMTL